MLYPVFFGYHIGLAFGAIPPAVYGVLKGLYGPVSVSIVALYISSLTPLRSSIKTDVDWISRVFWAYIFWALIWTAINVGFFTKIYTDTAAVQLLQGLVFHIANFAVGTLLIVKKDKFSFYFIGMFWLCMAAYTILQFDKMSMSLATTLHAEGPEVFASYQGFARSMMVTSLLLLAVTKGGYLRYGITLLSMVTLFLLGGRSEMLGFLFAVLVFESAMAMAISRHIPRWITMGLLVLAGVTFYIDELLAITANSRVLNLLSLRTDSSWLARNEFNQIAVDTIMDNPFFGAYGSHFEVGERDGGAGAHNILSAWVMLGLPGFITIALLAIGSFLLAFKSFIKSRAESPIWSFALLLSASMVPQILVSKSAFAAWFPLAFGLVLNAKRQDYQRLHRYRQKMNLLEEV